jgi:predicted acyl esterase
MIPMRDGVKLHTVMIIPKGLTRAPMLLNRTPYGISWISDSHIARLDAVLPPFALELTSAGYILVFQDVRGRFGSEGDYCTFRRSDPLLDHSMPRRLITALMHTTQSTG